MSRRPSIRFRCPYAQGAPAPGHIIMGSGPRVRRAYRVLAVRNVTATTAALGSATWHLDVEPMSAGAGRREITDGSPSWGIKWDSRRRKTP